MRCTCYCLWTHDTLFMTCTVPKVETKGNCVLIQQKKKHLGCVMAQAVNHRLLNTEVLEFKSMIVHVRFMVSKVVMGELLLNTLVYWCQVSFHHWSNHIYHQGMVKRPIGGSSCSSLSYNLIKWKLTTWSRILQKLAVA